MLSIYSIGTQLKTKHQLLIYISSSLSHSKVTHIIKNHSGAEWESISRWIVINKNLPVKIQRSSVSHHMLPPSLHHHTVLILTLSNSIKTLFFLIGNYNLIKQHQTPNSFESAKMICKNAKTIHEWLINKSMSAIALQRWWRRSSYIHTHFHP